MDACGLWGGGAWGTQQPMEWGMGGDVTLAQEKGLESSQPPTRLAVLEKGALRNS